MRLGRLEASVGRLTIVGEEKGLQAVVFADEPAPDRALEGRHPLLRETERQLQEHFAGERHAFDLRLDLAGTSFQRRAWLGLA
jgi:methylated-DNA-[protein]-cysteine S-methyltransferase